MITDTTNETSADGYFVTNIIAINGNGGVEPIGQVLHLVNKADVVLAALEEIGAHLQNLHRLGVITEMPEIEFILMDGCRTGVYPFTLFFFR